MDDLLLQPLTRRRVAALMAAQPHAVLLSGQQGAGLATLARTLARDLLGLSEKQFSQYAYAKIIEPIDGIISADQAREITGFLRLRTTGKALLRRIIIVDGMDVATTDAQNMLLKTLEEPPLDTCIILTLHEPQRLLETVRSRCQRLDVLPPSLSESLAFFAAAGYDEAAIRQAYSLSGGGAGLMQALLADAAEHPLMADVARAKQLLQASSFERLAALDQLIKDGHHTQVVWAFIRMSEAALAAAAEKGQESAVLRWRNVLVRALRADDQLRAHAQPKLVMTNLFLGL